MDAASRRPCSCDGQARQPWSDAYLDHETDIILKYLECPGCHAQTEAFANSDDAAAAWDRGEVTIPDWAAPNPPHSPAGPRPT